MTVAQKEEYDPTTSDRSRQQPLSEEQERFLESAVGDQADVANKHR